MILPPIIGAFLLITSLAKSLQFQGWRWVAFALSAYIVFVVGRKIHLYAFQSAKKGNANMNTLISIGTLSAWVWSVVSLSNDGTLYFATAAIVTIVVLFGQWLEGRTTKGTHNAIARLNQMVPKKVLLETGEEIEITNLQPDMLFRAREGEFIASDGIVVEGEAALDTSMITGEPLSHRVEINDEVIGSTIVRKGSLLIKATHTGENTFHRHIMRLIEQTLNSQTPTQRLVDKVSGIYTYVVILIALLTVGIWLLTGSSGVNAFEPAIAVLIIACPCALGLATPIAILAGTSRGAELGIILKDTTAIERIKKINTIALDKTGTLTSGKIHIQEITLAQNATTTKEDLLKLAVALESHSTHPIAIAIASSTKASSQKTSTLPDLSNIESVDGTGIRALLNTELKTENGNENIPVAIGKADLFDEVPKELIQAQLLAQSKSGIAVLCGRTKQAEGLIVLNDNMREEAKSVISELKSLNMNPVMITGDAEMPAKQLGKELGIDEIHFNILPDKKASLIKELQNPLSTGKSNRKNTGKNTEKNTVLMVGDGTNDAAALAAADLSIAIGSATEIALESADIALLGTDLKAIPTTIKLTLKTRSTIISNLFWAFIYNTAAIPLAAFGILPPIIASVAMSLSSLFVVLNSVRLRRTKFN